MLQKLSNRIMLPLIKRMPTLVILYILTRKDKQRYDISQYLQMLEELTKLLKIKLKKTL